MSSVEVCKIEGCVRPHSARGWCALHYARWSRNGDPLAAKWDGALTYPADATCSVEGCDRAPKSRGWCSLHYSRWQRHGDIERREGYRVEVPTYRSAHTRVTDSRGRASAYACVDCGRKAHHWSYDHGDPDEIVNIAANGWISPYSADPTHYEPRCASCHAAFDGSRIYQWIEEKTR